MDSYWIPRVPADRASPSGSPTASANKFKNRLLLLQESAPKPRKILCYQPISPPSQYGDEFHGLISREQADQLLMEHGEGSYLVRESARAPNAFTLCLRFDGATKNYKLYFDGQQHYVGEKRFNKLEDLVADGLIHMYVEKHAAEYIRRMTEETVYEESPYSEYQRRAANRHAKKRFMQRQAVQPRKVNKPRSRHSGISEELAEEPASDRSGSSDAPRRISNGGADSLSSMPGVDGRLDSLSSAPTNYSLDSNNSNGDFGPDGTQICLSEKNHVWRTHTWRAGGSWCDFCRNWMWGLVQQGLKCEDCGFAAHQRCSERVLPDCRPDLKYVKRMFAIDLTTLTMAHQCDVPPVVVACVKEIEARGLKQDGLYRVNGKYDEINSLRYEFDRKGTASLSQIEGIHSVAGLLKLYFRSLPVPIVTYPCYREIINVVKSPSLDERHRLFSLARALRERLPRSHYVTLKYFVTHLANVVHYSEFNQMTVENLAKIFAPTIMVNPDPSEAVKMSGHEQFLVALMISHVDELFAAYDY